jgi:hypothetical protein
MAPALLAFAALPGCMERPQRAELRPHYATLGLREVPDYLKGTVYEQVDVEGTEGARVAGYALVGRLRGTGDSTAPAVVRQFMLKEMVKHGFGSSQIGYKGVQPEDVLRDPNYAIVRVDGMIPPGARKDQFFDVQVSALPGNRTTSLSRGVLFETDLRKVRDRSLQLSGPGVLARAKGPILVNPAYALDVEYDKNGNLVPRTPAAVASLRSGVVMDRGVVMQDRPILLRVREPNRSVARAIENRINQQFQGVIDHKKGNDLPGQADALDEGIVHLYVPAAYAGDWEHFVGVCKFLYLTSSPAFAVTKAKELAEVAQQPDAPLMEISYAWEGLGAAALPHVMPLMAHANPDVSYAAARAAAFIGDPSGAAVNALMRIAKDNRNAFQIAAVQTLGRLQNSTMVNHLLRQLLDSDQTLVRIEAYKVLAGNRDSSVYTIVVPKKGESEKFALDIVPSEGPPLVYASRRGIPRIAVIGRQPELQQPLTFMSMNDKLMIASDPKGRNVTIFFRDRWLPNPVTMLSHPDVAEVVHRLGGGGGEEEAKLDFTYGEVLAILQELGEKRKMVAYARNGAPAEAQFVLQESPRTEDEILSAPLIPEGRPQSDDDKSLFGVDMPAPQPTPQGSGAGR